MRAQTRSFSAPAPKKINFEKDSVVGKGPFVLASLGVAYALKGLAGGAPRKTAENTNTVPDAAIAADTATEVVGGGAVLCETDTVDVANLLQRLDGIDMRNRVLNHDLSALDRRVAAAEFDLGLDCSR